MIASPPSAERRAASAGRRALLKTGVAALALAPLARANAAGGQATIRQGLFTGVGLPGLFAALQQGYFKQQGIALDLQFFGNGPAMLSAMLGGSLDVTHADTLSWASAVVAGRHIVLVTPASLAPTPDGDRKSTWRLVATKASGITSARGLVGRTVGVGASQLSLVALKAWLAEQGIDPGAVKIEIVGKPQAMPNMLSSGAVDAAPFGDPIIAEIDKQVGITILGWPYEAVPPEATFSGLFCTAGYAAASRDLLVRYVRAYRRGAAYFDQASQLERARLMKYADVDLEALDRKFPGLIESFRYNRAASQPVDVGATQRWVDKGVKYGGVSQPVDIAPFVSDTAKEDLG